MNIITELNPVINSLKESEKLEYIRKIIDVQQQINDLINENQWLRREKEKSDGKLELWNQLKFEDDAYWLKEKSDGMQGPYCPKCYGTEQKLVPMVKNGEECPNCRYSRGKIRL